jgi:hypothetical protein
MAGTGRSFDHAPYVGMIGPARNDARLRCSAWVRLNGGEPGARLVQFVDAVTGAGLSRRAQAAHPRRGRRLGGA